MEGHVAFESFLRGDRLYGDDFDAESIEQWYEDEREGYANLVGDRGGRYEYTYHQLNSICGFRFLRQERYARALGFGSAFGDEFVPIRDRLGAVTIVDPSDQLVRDDSLGVPLDRVKPDVSGTLPMGDETFDLVLCLGVLHHIPNVSHVLGELHRVLKPRGEALIREPIISMGDWRKPRPGLTRRERGIPLAIFREMLAAGGWGVRRETLCTFPGVGRLCDRLGITVANSRVLTRVDLALCRLLRPNLRYHADRWYRRLRPTAAYYVLERS